MKREHRDFVALFNALWYKDFPVIAGHEELGKRAVWTTHIASVIKQCADLLGRFTCFESGGRTDAVIQTASRKTWAKIEWEWSQPFRDTVNELDKLAKSANENEAELMIFIGYSFDAYHEENMAKILKSWKGIDTPLLVFLITCHNKGKRRHFETLETHYLCRDTHKVVDKRSALPWNVPDTKWAATNGSLNDEAIST
jgi:hypothetical protein